MTGPVSYLHFACDDHEIVCANGHWVETLLRGDATCPLMAEIAGRNRLPARALLRGYEARALAAELQAV
ncbi:hypothetical protein JSE7799_00752 [Jannaschia seosinensis]|uniref:Hedgehog/Intein (Hint) domain-containing protein n=1 Tax=Jannaschia seosinensis TaxID=313367 RepID=A0A0M7B5F7_9RHOB|nr:hypothetical protein [Jannaschia seosinensis]CUH26784.1 hypothetical protein JSE7799_00752 [Jannaschia seosinensis]